MPDLAGVKPTPGGGGRAVGCFPAVTASASLSNRLPAALAAVFLLSLGACSAGPTPVPHIAPGTSEHPREVPIVAKDYLFVPQVLDLVPGETVVLQVVNGGLVVHEAVVGPIEVQAAWEGAEGPTASSPPGPTAAVSVAPGLEGVRVVVGSGERRDATWTVPTDVATAPAGWYVGCHIPGHWAQGMVIPIRWVDAAGDPIAGAPVATIPPPPLR
jgi:hypothetical protein